jgi:hypothetical protein
MLRCFSIGTIITKTGGVGYHPAGVILRQKRVVFGLRGVKQALTEGIVYQTGAVVQLQFLINPEAMGFDRVQAQD